MPISAAWARDACRCQECRDPRNDQHLIDVGDLVGWEVIDAVTERDRLIVMIGRNGVTHRCEIPDRIDDIGVTLWDDDHVDRLTGRSADGSGPLGEFVSELVRFGIAMAHGLPIRAGAVLEFGKRIGFVRQTNYGDLFDVVTAPDPNNLAFTALGLPLHTDNPYRDPCPTVQLLHCLASAGAGGGVSRFADGFRAAEMLRSRHEPDFEVLAKTMLTFRFHDDLVDLRARRPLIELDPTGEVVAISINHRSMEAPDPATCDVDAFYRAYLRLARILDAGAVEIALRPGELVALDNRRVLHGRSAFDVATARHLQGCYIDMDSIRSAALVR